MSQAKVDKYKKEKKNRAKNIKKAKIKKIVGIFVGALLVGSAIGYPLGKHMYKVNRANREANTTIKAENVDYWTQQHFSAYYSYLFPNYDDIASGSDALEASDATTSDSTASDATNMDAE